MKQKLIGFFSGFPSRHFSDTITDSLKEVLNVRDMLVFISAWPDDYEQNDADSDGMYEMFAERNMSFKKHCVIDNRTEATNAVKLIREGSCIFLMGGNATKQFQLMHDKGLIDEIHESHAVILGVSAGSINMGKHSVDIWESLIPYNGLGLADITVKAHFKFEDEKLVQTLKQLSMQMPVCAMEDESAIFITDDTITQIGQIHRIIKGEIVPLTVKMLEQMIYSSELNTEVETNL